jgi:hypothetical protein
VPGLRFVDAANGVLGIEWVNGKSVRCLLGSGDEGEEVDGDGDGDDDDDDGEAAAERRTSWQSTRCQKVRFLTAANPSRDRDSHGTGTDALMAMVGAEIAKMHLADIIHGDLTTSNMMVRHPSSVVDSLREDATTGAPASLV